jgi:hypothetical protein
VTAPLDLEALEKQVLGAVTDGTWDYVKVGRDEFRAMCAAARGWLSWRATPGAK